MAEKVEGLAESASLLGAIPDAAREQMGVELGLIGRDVLNLQRAAVPIRSGDLRGGLTLKLLIDALRVRVGLLDLKKGRSPLYYGRFVNYGRKAQTVIVQRRRRVNGKLRSSRGRKNSADISATYKLNVKAEAAHPFIEVDFDEVAAVQRLRSFWDSVIGRAEGGATG